MLSYRNLIRPGMSASGAMGDWMLGMTLRGRNHEFHSGGDFSQGLHDLIVIKANTDHRWKVTEDGGPWEVIYFIFHPGPAMMQLLKLPEIRPGIMRLSLAGSPVRGKVRAALLEGHRVLNSHLPNRENLAMNCLENALLWCQAEMNQARTPVDPRIQKAIEYLANNLGRAVYLADVARAASLSTPRLMTLFRKHAGTTPMEYLERERMERASEMLSLSYHAVKEIAGLVGYGDTVHFSKRFARRFKLSPKAYRLAQKRKMKKPS